MMNHSQNEAVQILRIKKLKGENIIHKAARHNLREIQAELGAHSHINPLEMHRNQILEGESIASEVANQATELMKQAGVLSLRKDAVLGLELICSLPKSKEMASNEFFNDALLWAKSYFNAPILSAVVHYDEAAPHCHILILPLVNGAMRGSKLMGYKGSLRGMNVDFQDKIGQRYGLVLRSVTRSYSSAMREQIAGEMVRAIQIKPSHLNNPKVANALTQDFAQKLPQNLMNLLGVSLPSNQPTKKKSFVEIMTKPCKNEQGRARA